MQGYHKVEIEIDELIYITSEEDEKQENVYEKEIIGKFKSKIA